MFLSTAQYGSHQIDFRWKVPVHRHLRDPGFGNDPIYTDRMVTMPSKQHGGGIKNFFARLGHDIARFVIGGSIITRQSGKGILSLITYIYIQNGMLRILVLLPDLHSD